jgi:CBS domain-containing protein/uncharacterized protein (DUF2267 family)
MGARNRPDLQPLRCRPRPVARVGPPERRGSRPEAATAARPIDRCGPRRGWTVRQKARSLLSPTRMSLTRYTQCRLVVLRPEKCVYEAVRAMEDNHIGVVIVHDGSQLVGVVTDRDLAIQVVGADLDPFDVQLREIVSAPAIVIPVNASEDDAARLMLNHRVRRIPIVDGAELVGLVTLDDLILEQAVDMVTCAAVLRAQLSEPSRLKRRGPPGPAVALPGTDAQRERLARRHTARATSAHARLVHRVLEATSLATFEQAEAALEEVVSGVARRISPEEARQFLAQLPSLLSDRMTPGLDGVDRDITRGTLEQAVMRRLSVDQQRADEILRHVWRVLVESIGPGEMDDVHGQLPPDMKEVFAP